MLYIVVYKNKNQSNAKKMLDEPIPTRDLLDVMEDGDAKSQLKNWANENFINFWDVGKKAMEYLCPQSTLAIVCGEEVRYVGKILGFVWDEFGEIGGTLGSSNNLNKEPYQNVIVLKRLATKRFRSRIEECKRADGFTIVYDNKPKFYKLEKEAERIFW